MTRWSWIALPLIAGLLLVLALAGVPRAGPAERAGADASRGTGAIERGRHIYVDGRLPNGRRLEAIAQGDVRLSGADAACVRCHQRSGLGANEGPVRAPAIVPSALMARAPPPVGLGPRALPSSSETSPEGLRARLATALLGGAGGASDRLDRSMPLYRLAPDELRDLTAYLTSLDEPVSPGVTAGELQLATLVSDAVPAPERRAWIDTLEAYLMAKNGGSRLEERRAAHAPWPERNEYEAYRKWTLEVWELTGPAETWGKQFRRRYEQRPVFAVVSGLLRDSFEPIAAACEALAVPCLFPSTPLTGSGDPGFYTFHFSRGVHLDADVIASELLGQSPPIVQVLQLYDATPAARAGAAALRAALDRRAAASGLRAPLVRDLPSDAAPRGPPDISQPAAIARAVVAWLDEPALARELAGAPGTGTDWFISTRLIDVPVAWFAERCGERRCTIVQPTDDAARATDLRRFGAWARSRGLAVTRPRVQLEAWFALLQLGEAVMHVRQHLNREFVLETIEHAAYRSLVTAGLPRLNLGPGQRLASRGVSVVRLGPGGIATAPRWHLP